MTKWQQCAVGAGAGIRFEWLEKVLKNLEDEANYIASKIQRLLRKSPTPSSPAENRVPTHLNNGGLTLFSMRRAARSEDIAKAVVMLIESDYLTGEILLSDGGMNLT